MREVNPNALLIAENFLDASDDLSGEGWHGAMNYAGFLRPVWSWLRSPDYHEPFLGLPGLPRLDGGATYQTMLEFQAVNPWRSLATSWSLIGSHDTPRVRTVLGDAETVAVAAGLLFTMPGVPMVFMGDELGGQGVQGEDARRPMPWHRPDTWDLDYVRAVPCAGATAGQVACSEVWWAAMDRRRGRVPGLPPGER